MQVSNIFFGYGEAKHVLIWEYCGVCVRVHVCCVFSCE